jgi:acyl-CoA reductase-like NAD-dependent aldehyde dehydrogenase
MEQGNAAAAVPLWINGHAYLTVPAAFHDVRSPLGGEVLRRTPLCGARAAQDAVAAARAALAPWAAQSAAARAARLAALAVALDSYAGHFAALLAEESGAPGSAEVEAALALLRRAPDPAACPSARIAGICGSAASPLYGPLQLAVPALLAGAVVIMKPDPAAPSALIALAELTGRCEFPGGVFSVVHGGEAAVDGLRAAGVEMLNA